MKPLDFLKAAGVAAGVLILDILLAVIVVYVWSIWFAPGHPRAYYESMGVPLARLSTRILGTALIFAACWLCARRRPQRNALSFAVAVVVAYALLDGASVAFSGFFTVGFGITIVLKLLAGIAGAMVATRFPARP